MLNDTLLSIPGRDRPKAKADGVIASAKSRTFQQGGYQVQIIDIAARGNAVEVLARVFLNSNQLGFGSKGDVDIERFVFVNPPLLVPDPVGNIIHTSNDRGQFVTSTYREDPEEALKLVILDATRIVAKTGTNIIPGKIGNTTYTIFSTRDGSLVRNVGGSPEAWTTIRSGNGTSEDDTSSATGLGNLLASSTSNLYQILSRYIFVFDTSPVTTEFVDTATLSFFTRTPGVIDGYSGTGSIAITEGTVANPAAFAITDFQANVSYTTRWVTADTDITSYSTEQYKDHSFNSTGKSAINGSGNTIVGAKIGWDVDNSPPTWASSSETFVRIYSYAEAGTTKDPKLTIVTGTAPSSNTATTAWLTA